MSFLYTYRKLLINDHLICVGVVLSTADASYIINFKIMKFIATLLYYLKVVVNMNHMLYDHSWRQVNTERNLGMIIKYKPIKENLSCECEISLPDQHTSDLEYASFLTNVMCDQASKNRTRGT